MLARDRAAAVETEAAYGRLGVAMDRASVQGTKALDASAASATRTAGVHEAAAKRTERAWYESGSGIVKAGKLITLGLLGAGAAAVDFAMKFEKATTQFNTQAGASVAQTVALKKGILDMAASVGATPDQLAGGMYHVVSSMNTLIPKAKQASVELGILREAAKGAAIGGADVKETTYALSSVMNSLGLHTIPGARKAMAELNAIVGTGDMHMQDLVSALSSGIVPAARTFHISLQSIGAALAYMTDRGVPAQQAATRLRMSIALLGAPTKQSAGIMHDLGLSNTEIQVRSEAMQKALVKSGVTLTMLSGDLRKPDGIQVALADLKKHMVDAGVSSQEQAAIIARAFGGGRSGGTIMAMYNNIDVVKAKYAQQSQQINAYDKDWQRTQHTLAFEVHQVEAGVETLGIKLGTILIPWVEKGISEGEKFVKWLQHNKTAAEALAVTIGTVLTAAVAAFAINSVRRVASVARSFYQMGRGIANLPGMLGSRISSAIGGPGTEAGAGAAVLGQAVTWGIRSATGPGSELNPLAVVVLDPGGMGLATAASGGGARTAAADIAAGDAAAASAAAPGALRTPGGVIVPTAAERGSLHGAPLRSGAVGSEPVVTAGERAAAAAGLTAPEVAVGAAAASRGSGLLSSARGALGEAVGGLVKVATSAGIAYAATQIIGMLVPGKVGHTIAGLGAGTAIGAGVGSLIGAPWVGGAIGGAIQFALQQAGAHGTLGDVRASVQGGVQGGALIGRHLLGVPGGIIGGSIGLLASPLTAALGLFTGTTGNTDKTLTKQINKAKDDLTHGLWTAAIHDANVARRTSFEVPGGATGEGSTGVTGRVAQFMRDVAQAAVAGEGRDAAKTWVDAFMQGLKNIDPTTDAGKAKVADKTQELTRDVKGVLQKLTPDGRLAFATAMDSWAQQMEQKNPTVKAPMDKLQSAITGDMHQLGQNIRDVNGQVLTDSTQQWKNISQAITNPVSAAQEKLAGTFGTIQAEAAGALEAVGYTSAEAHSIVAGMVAGKGVHLPSKVTSPLGAAVKTVNAAANAVSKGFAGGGRVPGAITGDTWSLVDPSGVPRGMVGGGELLISNRHTEAMASAATMAAYGKTMGQLVAGETTAHAAPGYATGGIFGGVGVNTHGQGASGIPGIGGGIAGALASAPLIQAILQVLQSVTSFASSGMGAIGPMSASRPAPSEAAAQALGRRMMLAAGWGADQWPYLQALWQQESGWNANAVNPSSGAYGIPQSLGHGNVYALGDARAQIAWGLNYIRGRYGSPAAAEAHEQQMNWYGQGGRASWGGWHAAGGDFTVNRPTVIGVGEAGAENVSIRPASQRAGTGGGPTIEVRIGQIVNHRDGDIAAIVEREIMRVAEDILQEHGHVPMESDLGLFR